MTCKLGICLALAGKQCSQYANYNFNSMCSFAGRYLGANENGIFEIDGADRDHSDTLNSEPIEAYIDLPTSDWGIDNQKRVRSCLLGLETDGQMVLTLTDDEGKKYRYDIEPNFVANQQHGVRVTAGRNNGKGRYWNVRLENVNGADFSLNRLTVYPVILGVRPARS